MLVLWGVWCIRIFFVVDVFGFGWFVLFVGIVEIVKWVVWLEVVCVDVYVWWGDDEEFLEVY